MHAMLWSYTNINALHKKGIEWLFLAKLFLETALHIRVIVGVKLVKFLRVSQFYVEANSSGACGFSVAVRALKLDHLFGQYNNSS
jgi:hypothetical protein